MQLSRLKKTVFAFITVVITVHAYVFFSLYVVHGMNISAIQANGGVDAFGSKLPIWAIVLIEFGFAFSLETIMGQPCSFRLAKRVFNPQTTHPQLFELAIISSTVALMCPAMSFIAALIYYPYAYMPFNFITLLANWLQLVCYNFAFAFFTQVFFIQPFVRTVMFKVLFRPKKQA